MAKISRNVVALGWVSFFTDLASEMLYPILPLFLIGTLGAKPAMLGLIDGLAEGISSGLRWIGGALSDRFRRRKPFIVLGYGLSAVSKPVMGLAQVFLGWPLFLIGRCADRFGKSVRTAARDALIADSTEPEDRGKAFGLHRAMDTAGAVLGPLLTLGIICWMVGAGTAFSARWPEGGGERGGHGAFASIPFAQLFYWAAIPGLMSVLLIWWVVREIAPTGPGKGAPRILQVFPKPFYVLLAANMIFSAGNSSDAFLILRASEVGMPFGQIILMYAMFNLVYAGASFPFGKLSDRIGRKPVLVAGYVIYALVYAGFAIITPGSDGILWAWILFGTYGLFQAMTEGVSKAMIADLVPSHQRAGAIGLFATASGLGQLIGSVAAGLMWEMRVGGVMPAFLMGAVCALLAIMALVCVPVKRD